MGKSSAFKFFDSPDIFSLLDLRIRFGRITAVEEYRNFCSVFFNQSEKEAETYYGHIQVGGFLKDSDYTKSWGLFSPPTENSCCLVATLQGRHFLLMTLPPLNLPEGTFEKWRSDTSLNVNRLPIATEDKRKDTITTNNNDDLVKKGELFLRSSGIADLLLDYIGNILFDTHKQFTIRIGDRNSTTNKISTPELQLDIGRVVDTVGEELVDSNNKKIKVKLNLVDKVTETINEDGDVEIKNSNTTVTIKSDGTIELGASALEKMVKGETFKTFFNSHIHPTPAGPSSAPTILMSDAQLSTKNKVGA